MSLHKLICKVEEDQAKAQMKGKFDELKVTYKISFEGALSASAIRTFISDLKCRCQTEEKQHLTKL